MIHDESHETEIVETWVGSNGRRYRTIQCQEQDCNYWVSEHLDSQSRLQGFDQ